MSNQIKIMLLEDDDFETKAFEQAISKRINFLLVSKSKSSSEALNFVKEFSPEILILDLELHNGNGSGFDFLNKLPELRLKYKPLIIVTTNISSNIIYDYLHKDLVDLIFYKKQNDYSADLVLDTLSLLSNKPNQSQKKSMISNEEKHNILSEIINKELDLIGISYKLKGREYIFEAIHYLLTTTDDDITVFQYLSNRHKLLTSSISRAIQTAINHTWRTSAIEDLKINYTAQINYHTGVPTPTEFIYYYVKKIKV